MSDAEAQCNVLTRLLEVVAETLDIDVQDASANFLALGGDSLSAIIVTETLQDEGISLKVEDLFSALPLDHVASFVEVQYNAQ